MYVLLVSALIDIETLCYCVFVRSGALLVFCYCVCVCLYFAASLCPLVYTIGAVYNVCVCVCVCVLCALSFTIIHYTLTMAHTQLRET